MNQNIIGSFMRTQKTSLLMSPKQVKNKEVGLCFRLCTDEGKGPFVYSWEGESQK